MENVNWILKNEKYKTIDALADSELLKGDWKLQTMIDNQVKRAFEEFDFKLKIYLRENLKDLDHHFVTLKEFEGFLRNRVARVQVGSSTAYYLDPVDENDLGTLIGITNERKINSDFQDGVFTFSIG